MYICIKNIPGEQVYVTTPITRNPDCILMRRRRKLQACADPEAPNIIWHHSQHAIPTRDTTHNLRPCSPHTHAHICTLISSQNTNSRQGGVVVAYGVGLNARKGGKHLLTRSNPSGLALPMWRHENSTIEIPQQLEEGVCSTCASCSPLRHAASR